MPLVRMSSQLANCSRTVVSPRHEKYILTDCYHSVVRSLNLPLKKSRYFLVIGVNGGAALNIFGMTTTTSWPTILWVTIKDVEGVVE
jgi:hypothetical protein